MSFILDALRKAEHQRQRHIGPSLADAPVRRRHEERPWWAIALVALLVANLGVLSMVLMRSGGQPGTQAPAHERASVVPPAAWQAPAGESSPALPPQPVRDTLPPARPASHPAPPVRSLAEEAEPLGWDPDINPALAAAARVPDGPPRVRPLDRAIEPPKVGAVGSEVDASAPEQEEFLPDATEMALHDGNVPDLHLDIHVYSPVPADRWVYINMNKYVEGQSLPEGPVVERIRADGVVLNQRGTRYLLRPP